MVSLWKGCKTKTSDWHTTSTLSPVSLASFPRFTALQPLPHVCYCVCCYYLIDLSAEQHPRANLAVRTCGRPRLLRRSKLHSQTPFGLFLRGLGLRSQGFACSFKIRKP